jgi:hypothetical protein
VSQFEIIPLIPQIAGIIRPARLQVVALSHLLLLWFEGTYQEQAGLGVRDGEGRVPGKVREGGVDLGELGGGDQEGEASGGGEERGGYGEDVGEAFDGAEGDYVEGGGGEGFGADVLYIDVRQCKGAGEFAEEGGFLLIGFDQGEGDVRGPELDGDAREAGARAEVCEAGFGLRALGFGNVNVKIFHHRGHRGRHRVEREEVASGEEGFAEVAGDDFFLVADGGEVDASVPAEEYIDVRRYAFIEGVVGRWSSVVGIL